MSPSIALASGEESRYTIPQAARLVGTSRQNVRRWLRGYESPTGSMKPVFGPREEARAMVSFLQLCELAVVAKYRHLEHPVPLDRLRRAHAFARETIGVPYPFASDRLRAEGGHIFFDFVAHDPGPGTLVLDRAGQWVLPFEVASVLENFDFDPRAHVASRWFPFGEATPIVVDPRHGSGMPTIAGRNVRADFLLNRWKGGEAIEQLAEDYELEASVVEAALRAAA